LGEDTQFPKIHTSRYDVNSRRFTSQLEEGELKVLFDACISLSGFDLLNVNPNNSEHHICLSGKAHFHRKDNKSMRRRWSKKMRRRKRYHLSGNCVSHS
jgi:hypothetical protein